MILRKLDRLIDKVDAYTSRTWEDLVFLSAKRRPNRGRRTKQVFLGILSTFAVIKFISFVRLGYFPSESEKWDRILLPAPLDIQAKVKGALERVRLDNNSINCEEQENFSWRICLEEKIASYKRFVADNCQVNPKSEALSLFAFC